MTASMCARPTLVRQRIGVVPQRPNPDRSLNGAREPRLPRRLLRHSARSRTERARDAAARAVRHRATRRRPRCDQLSGGQQQRLMIARALIHEPRRALSRRADGGPRSAGAARALGHPARLHAQGRTIVMTTHYMEEADQLCDRVAIVDSGRLLAVRHARGAQGAGARRHADRAHARRRRGRRSLSAARALPGVLSARGATARSLRVYSRSRRRGDRGADAGRGAGAVATVQRHPPRAAEPRDAVHLAHRAEARVTTPLMDVAQRRRRPDLPRAPAARRARRARASCRSSCCAPRCSRSVRGGRSATCCPRWASCSGGYRAALLPGHPGGQSRALERAVGGLADGRRTSAGPRRSRTGCSRRSRSGSWRSTKIVSGADRRD